LSSKFTPGPDKLSAAHAAQHRQQIDAALALRFAAMHCRQIQAVAGP
jgi:hypothetical protein